MIKVTLNFDSEGEIYLIPENLQEKFTRMRDELEELNWELDDRFDEVCDEFDTHFSPYKLEGGVSDIQLYISEEDLKDFTGEL